MKKEKETSVGVTQKERLAGIRKMLREQLRIGVYGAEGTQIQDEIIKEHEGQAEIKEPGDEQIDFVKPDAGISNENNTVAPKYQHHRILSYKEQGRMYYKPSEPYVPETGSVYEEWKDNDLYRRAMKAADALYERTNGTGIE